MSIADQIQAAEREIRSLQGKLRNRSSEPALTLERELEAMARKLGELETSLLAALNEALQPRQSDEALQQAEVLRLATVEYCHLSKVDPELWKNIAF